jgi:hypothetical protein
MLGTSHRQVVWLNAEYYVMVPCQRWFNLYKVLPVILFHVLSKKRAGQRNSYVLSVMLTRTMKSVIYLLTSE